MDSIRFSWILLVAACATCSTEVLNADPYSASEEPLLGLGPAANAQPAVADLFHNQRFQCVVGGPSGGFMYLERNGATGKFRDRTGLTVDPFRDFDVGAQSSPAFVDLDGDGDKDLVSGDLQGQLHYFPNLGTATSPVFSVAGGVFNPFNGIDVGLVSRPAFADLDGDGDPDLVCGALSGELSYFENSGDMRSPKFADVPNATHPFTSIKAASTSAPAFGDEDRDGDLDLFLGAADGSVVIHCNTGNQTQPQFSTTPATGQNGSAIGFETGDALNASPTVVDIDLDGDVDLIVGVSTGSLLQFTDERYLVNVFYNFIPEEDDPPNEGAELRLELSKPANGDFPVFLRVDPSSTVDIPGDISGVPPPGELLRVTIPHGQSQVKKRIWGRSDSEFDPYEKVVLHINDSQIVGTKSTAVLRVHEPIIANYELQDEEARQSLGNGGSGVWMIDIDADGDLDWITTVLNEAPIYWENTGSALRPKYVRRTQAESPFGDLGNAHRLAFGDVDDDGDQDILAGWRASQGSTSFIVFFENTGTASDPIFTKRDGADNPLFFAINGSDLYFPELLDLDADGDLDCIVGSPNGPPRYFRNVGNAREPKYFEMTGDEDPFNGLPINGDALGFGDVDGDGDYDMSVGQEFWENTGWPIRATFRNRTSASDPLAPLREHPQNSRPLVFVDLDGDRDLDIVDTGHSPIRIWKNRLEANDPYRAWQRANFDLPGEAELAARSVDADGDGESNYFEFLSRTNPRASGDVKRPKLKSILPVEGGGFSAGYTFRIRDDLHSPFVLVEESNALTDWNWFGWIGSISDANESDGFLEVNGSLRLSPARPYGRFRVAYDP